jgi:hypothetical protein
MEAMERKYRTGRQFLQKIIKMKTMKTNYTKKIDRTKGNRKVLFEVDKESKRTYKRKKLRYVDHGNIKVFFVGLAP